MSRPFTMGRRFFLRGAAGTAVALPLLQFSNRAWAQTAATTPKRFIVFFEHGGYISNSKKNGSKYDGNGAQNGVDAWKPTSLPGQPLTLGATHQPLAGMEKYLLVLRGIDNIHCKHDSPYNGDHGWANASVLTGTTVVDTSGKPRAQGPSIDAELANRLAQRHPAPFAEINLRANAHNYGTPFYSAANQLISSEPDPLAAFTRIFQGVQGSTGGTPDQAALKKKMMRQSVLDGTRESVEWLKRRATSQDVQTVDAHLEHIRELEKRVAALDVPVSAGCTVPTMASSYSGLQNIAPAQVDLMIAAFRCGLTNVATLEIGDFHATWLNPPFDAAYNIGHSLHHAAREVGATGPQASRFNDWYKTMLDNRQYRMMLLRRLMDGLAATPEGAGTMLDNTVILCTSEFSTGADHSVSDLPVLLAGGAAGRLKMGTHFNFNVKAAADPNTRSYQTTAGLHNVYTSIVNAFDFPDANWGAPTTDFKTSGGTLVSKYVPGPLPGVNV